MSKNPSPGKITAKRIQGKIQVESPVTDFITAPITVFTIGLSFVKIFHSITHK
jgi:hypothetical protein